MNNKPILTIFYQFCSWHSSIGAIQTFIGSFLKYTSSEFEVRLVGTGGNNTAIGNWQEKEFASRKIDFRPLIKLENDEIRHLIPTALKYTAALFKHNFASRFMHFHRGELKGSRLAKIVKGAGLFVSPSNLEGLALTILEAMRKGMPVVARNTAPYQQLLDSDRGVLFDSANVIASVKALKQGILHPELTVMAKKNLCQS